MGTGIGRLTIGTDKARAAARNDRNGLPSLYSSRGTRRRLRKLHRRALLSCRMGMLPCHLIRSLQHPKTRN